MFYSKAFKSVVLGGIITAAYKIGEAKGHVDCLKNLVKTYAKDMFNDDGTVVDGKRFKITITKIDNSEELKNMKGE